MRLAFMGTPAFAATCLSAMIAAGRAPVAVYARAAKPAGRGQKTTPTPVEKVAREAGIEVRTPKGFKSEDPRRQFESLGLDAAIVVAYGLILPKPILQAPRLGCFNLHASLLPRWRGAAPIQRAIMAGDKVTGVQVMRMEEGLDTGPILLSEATAIRSDDTAATLHDRLAEIASGLLPRFLAALERGSVVETAQIATGVTYADKISPTEAEINWGRPAIEVDAHIRGLSPFPGAWFETRGTRVKALMSAVCEGDGEPGSVLAAGERLVIACREGAVALSKLQRAGKSPQSASEFLRGFSLTPGTML